MGCGGSNAGAVAVTAKPASDRSFQEERTVEVNPGRYSATHPTENSFTPHAVDIYEIFGLEERRRGGLLNVTWTLTSIDADSYDSTEDMSPCP